MQVWSLGQEDPLEKGMAMHASILVWRISWTKEPGGLQSMGSHSVRHDWVANTFIFTFTLLLVHDFKLQAELEFKTNKQTKKKPEWFYPKKNKRSKTTKQERSEPFFPRILRSSQTKDEWSGESRAACSGLGSIQIHGGKDGTDNSWHMLRKEDQLPCGRHAEFYTIICTLSPNYPNEIRILFSNTSFF